MILFLSKYPKTRDEFKDGFFQRVVNVDKFFEQDERTYLDISLFKYFSPIKSVDGNRKIIHYNFFLNLFSIVSLFRKAKVTYIQSIHNLLYTFLFVKFIKGKYVLDLHGVVIEELIAQKLFIQASLFKIIEKIAFPKLNFVVAVTNKLANVYRLKYPNAQAKYILYAILPNNLSENKEESIVSKDSVHVIYSGNTQVWQNIDLMLTTIANNQNKRIVYTILTGDLGKMRVKLSEYKLSLSENLIVKSVMPNDLAEYYLASNYGFILRDDNLINNVACPTKMVEYLNYGIIPIVLSENIGDFLDLGFEYIKLEDFNINIAPLKSSRNKEVIKTLNGHMGIDLRSMILQNV